jgi:uncharacterized protein YmfQ (DUF2313 family)
VPINTHSADQYRDQLRSLLPPGRVWPESLTSRVSSLLWAIAEEFARLEVAGCTLIDEADPRTTSSMLADWERAAGLPDECHGLGDTAAARRAELTAKLAANGSCSRQFYTNVAAQLGFVVASIDEFTPSSPGPGGLGFAGDDWYFVWRLNVEDDGGITYFTCDSLCDERLSEWGDQVLECVIDRIKPAHTRVLFAYI